MTRILPARFKDSCKGSKDKDIHEDITSSAAADLRKYL